jgi:uncharacterized membrane protein
MGRANNIWLNFKSSLWFLPSLMVFASILLALGMVELDHSLELDVDEQGPRFFGASSDGARKVLATIAGSMITVAGVIFSITIVTLSLAANQYTPRILRNFTKDKGNQLVLGFFVSLFTYCLLVLRTIRGGDEGFIPAVSVLVAIVLAIIGIYLFIYFIHHSTLAIQASEILSAIASETNDAVDAIFPDELGEEESETEPLVPPAPGAEQRWHRIHAASSGYIQAVDQEALLRWSQNQAAVLKMEKGVGEFVIRDSLLASALADKRPEDEQIRELNQAYAINQHRSIEQDPAFGIRQIVDIALKALSPSMNDSTTAVSCVDHLAQIMHRVIRRKIPSCYRYSDGELRVIACGDDFESLLNLAFNEIRQNARDNVALLLRILERLEDLAEPGISHRRRAAIWKHVRLFRESSNLSAAVPHDRKVLNHAFQRVARKLGRTDEMASLEISVETKA